jgi:hypothetical protein
MIGGARPFLVHRPDECQFRDDDDLQIEGVPEFFRTWADNDVKGWDEAQPTQLGREANDGGCWVGGEFEASSHDHNISFTLLILIQSKRTAPICSRSSVQYRIGLVTS